MWYKMKYVFVTHLPLPIENMDTKQSFQNYQHVINLQITYDVNDDFALTTNNLLHLHPNQALTADDNLPGQTELWSLFQAQVDSI